MLKKPTGYDTIQASIAGESKLLPAGIYSIRILNAKEETSKAGNRMIVLSCDICSGEYKDYFLNKFKSNSNENKKWGCNFYQLVDGEHTSYFKGLITAIEKSNGFTWNWELNSLKNHVVAGVFQRQEIETGDGKTVWATKLISIRSVENMDKIKIPDDKPLAKPKARKEENTVFNEDDIPF